ncbi:MAG: hypothetical protein CMJ64_27115 [Planctomycetaceae bacterium]|nr:hypothetical protein [Planctomycetaceae bacterium]
MSEFLFEYHPVHPTTWVYLSSLLMLGVFFKFSRFWSVRNIDLVLLLLLAPGLLTVQFGEERAREDQVEKELTALSAEFVEVAEEPGIDDTANDPSEEQPVEDEVASEPAPPNSNSREPEAGIEPDTDPTSADIAYAELAAADGQLDVESDSGATRLSGKAVMLIGYIWLWVVLGLLLARLLLDATMVRRPLLEPNLSTGGLAFLGCSLFVFLMANVINGPATADDLAGARSAGELLAGVSDGELTDDLDRHGPGNALLHSIPSLVTTPLNWEESESADVHYVRTAKVMALMSHLAVVLGIIAIGYRHFGNIKMGIGAATLYLMLPYTSQMTGRVDHVLPASLLVWAIVSYRRPLVAGSLLGLAGGVAYYPLFLLPLWVSFYWQRGLGRFVTGMLVTIGICVCSLLFVSADIADFGANVQRMFGLRWPRLDNLHGVWKLGWDPIYRLPVIAAFLALCSAFALWPAQKNLGTLLSCSAAIMVATQAWHGDGGGLYMAWFLPLTLLTIFRPNLEDRVALSVLEESWLPRRRFHLTHIDCAA